KFLYTHIFIFMVNGDVVRDAIILRDGWMIHRNVRESLVEIRDRIATHIHYFLYQDIRTRHRGRWIIYELCLGVLPFIRKSTSLLIGQRLNIQFFHASLPLLQNLLR